MGLLSQMKTWQVFHLLLGFTWIISGIIVAILMLFTWILVWPFNRTLYRKIVVNLAYSIWCQFTFLTQWWSGSDCTVHMEDPDSFKHFGNEDTIVIMNHKYDIDWMMTWILSERVKLLGGTKVFAKSSLRFVPIIGWLWFFTETIFLKREWDKDKNIIAHDLQGVCSYPPGYWVTLLLFPEGTRFTDRKHKESMQVARSKGIPELKHHLLPRTKGFVHSMHGLRGKFTSITDVTLGFKSQPDGTTDSFLSLLFGKPSFGEMFVRRIPIDEVPEDDEKCAQWLHQLFREKDEIFEDFALNGHYTRGETIRIPWRWTDLLVEIAWLSFLSLPIIYYLLLYIWNGSLLLKIIFGTSMATLSYVMRAMIAVTEIHSSSSAYGSKDKKAN